jgi:Family of unknown function (DUF6221)
MTIAEFITARWDEIEAVAREAQPGPWHIGNTVDPTKPANVHTFPGARLVARGVSWLDVEHIACQHPTYVLADIAAKRRQLAEHQAGRVVIYRCQNRDHIQGWQCERAGCPREVTRYCDLHDYDGPDPARCRTKRLMALPFAAHPDYLAQWAV